MPTLKLCVDGLRSEDEVPLAEALMADDGVLGAVVCARMRSAEIDFEDDRVSIERILDIVALRGFQATLSG